MKIYIDADSVPVVARQLIIKTANRTQTLAIFVANHYLKLPPSAFIQSVVVSQGFDVADDYISDNAKSDDLVITSDIPLADSVIDKGAKVLTMRGEELTCQNIKQKLASRDFMDMMRGTNVLDMREMGGQKPYDDKDKQRFANALNRLVPTNTQSLP